MIEIKRQFDLNPNLLIPNHPDRPDYDKCIRISTDASLREMVAPGALVMLSPIVIGVLFGTKCVTGLLAGAIASGVQMAISASNTGGAWDNAKKYIGKGGMDDLISQVHSIPPQPNPLSATQPHPGPAHFLPSRPPTLPTHPAPSHPTPTALYPSLHFPPSVRLALCPPCSPRLLQLEPECIKASGEVNTKKSQIYKAAVTGDTVGDPLKDTSGPALNILMKLMAIISVVFADFFLSINDGGGLISYYM